MRGVAVLVSGVALSACGPPSVATLVADREYAEAVAATRAFPEQRDAVGKALLADLELRVWADVVPEDRLRDALGDAYPALQGQSVLRVLPTWNPVEDLSIRVAWTSGGNRPVEPTLHTLAEMSGERRYPSTGERVVDTARSFAVLTMALSCGLTFGAACPSDKTMSAVGKTSDSKYAPTEENAPRAARVVRRIALPGVGLVPPVHDDSPLALELAIEVSPRACEVQCGALRYRAVMDIPPGGSMHARFARHFGAFERSFSVGAVTVVP